MRPSASHSLARGPVAILTALLALARPAPAAACGGMVFPDHEERVGGMSDQELAVLFAADETVLFASAGYVGVDAAEFAFVLPLATPPSEVLDADPALFLALDEFSAPRVGVWTDDGGSGGLCSGAARGDSNALGDTGGDGVMVHQRGETATYEYVVVGGGTGTAVADWLSDAGYPLPADYAAALQPYVDGDWSFFAAKVKPGAAAGNLAPIELHLPPATPESFKIPLGLATHSLAPDAPLRVTTYILAGGPVLTANYPSQAVDRDDLVALSEADTNWADLERGILDSDPQGAWIIDYSNAFYGSSLVPAFDEGVAAGRIDRGAGDRDFLAYLADRLDLNSVHLTRLRTELRPGQVRDLELRHASGPQVDNYYSVSYDPDAGQGGCRLDRSGHLPQLLLLLPVLAWIRRRPRRA